MNRSFFGIYHPTHKLALLLGDLCMLALAFYIATHYRLNGSPNYQSLEYMGLNIIFVASLFIGGAYTSSRVASRPKLPLNTFFISIAATLPSLLFIYLLGPEKFTALLGRGVFPFAVVIFATLSVFCRFIIDHFFLSKDIARVALLLGTTRDVNHLEQSLLFNQHKIKLRHVEHLSDQTKPKENLSAIIISPDHFPNKYEQQALINYRLKGIPIFSLSDFFENYLFLVPVQEINNDWFIRAEGFTMLHSSVATRIKRAVDIAAALALMISALPIILVTAVVLKTTSRGPVFFSQIRVGVQGKPFTLYKFRTMRADAEHKGAQWTMNNDPRILPIGRFLRACRIDELPQCWNILRGEMSIVGPRPERPEFTSKLSEEIPYYDLRHIIKPGLTGWAQVNYPYGASVEDSLKKLQYDLYYIKNYSLLLDLNILLRTVLVTLHRGGR